MEVFQDLAHCAERHFENITGGIRTEKPGCSDLKISQPVKASSAIPVATKPSRSPISHHFIEFMP